MITVKILRKPAIEKVPKIIEALVSKMNELMFKLQTKVITEKIPGMFKTQGVMAAAIKDSIVAMPATVTDNKIVGIVDGGGTTDVMRTTLRNPTTYDIAVVQERGVAHEWKILPFNKKALAFQLDGRTAILSTLQPGFGEGGNVVVKSVQHPGIAPHPFMHEALHDMEAQITSELKEAFYGALNG